jgi:DNA-binding IclR family transcriptional regulator
LTQLADDEVDNLLSRVEPSSSPFAPAYPVQNSGRCSDRAEDIARDKEEHIEGIRALAVPLGIAGKDALTATRAIGVNGLLKRD